MLLKIGELAQRTGITVRTLHHYDKLDLLTPSVRSEAGYRLYNRHDIARLHRIQALRRLDLSLHEIGELIQGDTADLRSVISQQILSLEEQIKQNQELRERLLELGEQLDQNDDLNMDYWLSTLEMMSLRSKYFSPEDIALWRQQKDVMSGKMELAMQPIVAKIREFMDAKIAPSAPQVLVQVQKWLETVHQSVPNPRLLKKFADMHRDEPSIQAMSGVDNAMMDYINVAAIEIRYQIYRRYLSEEECQYFRPSFMRNVNNWTELFIDLKKFIDAGIAFTDPIALKRIQDWRAMFLDAWGNRIETIQKVRQVHEKEPRLTIGGGLSQEVLDYAVAGMRYMETQNLAASQSTKSAKTKPPRSISKKTKTTSAS